MLRIPLSYPEGTPDRDKWMRAESDRRLIGPAGFRRGEAAGEALRLATAVGPFEWLLIKLRILK